MKPETMRKFTSTLVVQVGMFALLIVMCRTCDLTVPQTTVQGYVGHSSLLRCSYSNCNDVELYWYSGIFSLRRLILQKVNNTITKYREGISLEGQADLSISSVTHSDEDIYTCKIEYTTSTKSKVISLNVDVAIAPSITSLNINRSPVIENDSINLTCTATGVPTPSYGWKVNGSTIGHQGRYLHFPSISRTDSGTYRCLASNIQGNAARDKSVDVYYLPSSPWPTCELTTSTAKGYIQEGDDVEITCGESGGNPSPGLQWFNDSSSLTGVYYGLADFGWTLTSHDNGIKYRCDGNHPAESPTRHCFTDVLDVKYSPMLPICADSGQSDYSEGDTVQITCQSMDGNPLANLRWFNSSESNPMKETTPPYPGYAVNQYSWTVSRADNRLSFDCQATNLVRATPLTCTTSEFQVNFASSQADLEGYTAPLTTGDNLNLMCTSGSSNPQSEIIWYRDDDVIGDSSSETIGEEVIEDGEFYGYVTTQNLTVDVQAKHNGVRYHCGTRNQILSLNGRTSANSTFVIMEVYFPPNQPEDCTTRVTGWLDYVVEGESLDLGCISCSANPAADVVWYRDGVLLTPDEVELTDGMYNGQRTMGHLEKEISFSDHGAEYSCEATSPGRFPNHIYQSQKVTLNVHYTPRIINDYDTNSTRINAGDSVILWCNISSNPRANITWLDQNGKIITNLTANRLIHEGWHDSQMMNSLRIRDVNSDVTGFYTCQVNNSVGGAEFTVYIEVIVESNTIALFTSVSVTLVAILLVVIVVVFCKKRRRKQKSIETSDAGNAYAGLQFGSGNGKEADKGDYMTLVFQNNQDGGLDGNKNPAFKADALGKQMNPCMKVEFDSITFIEDLYTGVFSKLVKGEIPVSERSKLVVCVKVVKANAGEDADEALLNEVRFLKTLQEHQNIVKMIGCSAEKAPYCIVYEYCPHGNLREYLIGLHKEVKRIDEYELEDVTFNLLCNFASQIASGMAFLGEIECIHRALAARNIQVWHDNVCKISEFGYSSKVMDVNTYEKMIEGRLPVRWMALESILECVYTAKSDVWSFGIVLWEIFNFGKQPYSDMSTKDVIRELQHGYRLPRPHYCDDVVHSIMVECWQDELGDRPTFQELVTSIGQNYI